MRCLYTTAPGQYGLTDRPMPEADVDEVLIKVVRAGLCHTDVIIRAGKADHVRYPVIPGHEFSGIVESCGAGVRNVKAGERVVVHTFHGCTRCASCRRGDPLGCPEFAESGSGRDGGFAPYCAVAARCLYTVPDAVTLSEAALAEPLANAVAATRRARVEEGDKVVVIGPGPIGLLAVQVARLANPSVLVLVGTRQERLKLGPPFGATHTVNVNDDGAGEKLADILGGAGADAVLECAGTPSALRLALDVVGRNGRIALEGLPEPDEMVTVSHEQVFMSLGISLMGIVGWLTKDFDRAMRLLGSGLVDAKPIITHTFGLEEWEEAFDMITERKSEAIKVEFGFGFDAS